MTNTSWQLPLAMGFLLLVLSKPISKFTIEGQEKVWGFHYSKNTKKHGYLVYAITGIAFLVYGAFKYQHSISAK